MSDEIVKKDFDVTELDDKALDAVAGGATLAGIAAGLDALGCTDNNNSGNCVSGCSGANNSGNCVAGCT